MGVSKEILKIGEALRPVITKVVPQKVLSRMKAGVVNGAAGKIDDDSVLRFEPERYKHGVNLIGNIRADSGLGESARIMARILNQCEGVNYIIKDFFIPPGGSRTDAEFEDRIQEVNGTELPYNINLMHINASEFVISYINMGRETYDYRYNIGYWAWELEEFPECWKPAFHLLDEIWTPSDFITNTLKKYTDKPVLTVPHCVEPVADAACDRAHFGLPEDKFLFLVMFNSGSVMERKNPLAAIRAFKEAFAGDEATRKRYSNVGLVIKISEAELSEDDEKIITSVIDKSDNIYIMCGMMEKTEVNALIADVDCYVSLHRAEGFGLVMAEAMYLGTPVIATNWSGNTEYMNNEVACMVDADMITLDRDLDPFWKGIRWADAHVTEAAEYMVKLVTDKDYYEQKKKAGREYAKEHLAYSRSAKIVAKRLAEIGAMPGAGSSAERG